MRVLKSNLHGLTLGTAPVRNNHRRTRRGEVKGWSHSATRRNLAFLRSVDGSRVRLDDFGGELISVAITLTIKDCPATAQCWSKLRKVYIDRLRRMGLVRMHWVTEWQRRKVPHLHAAAWFDADSIDIYLLTDKLIKSWCDCASEYKPLEISQFVTQIYDEIGWFRYVAKHAARGVTHYQRSALNIPDGWKTKTGRVWGKVGDWEGVSMPVCEDSLTSEEYYKLRRVLRSWRVADSRESKNKSRVVSARRMLRCNDVGLSHVRGCSEWFSQDLLTKVMTFLRSA